MKRNILLSMVLLFSILMSFSVFAVAVNPWIVNGALPDNSGCNTTTLLCKDIQSAIDAASDENTINIVGGTYILSSTLSITKKLTLIGESENSVIIDASTIDGYGISISSDNVTLEKITLFGPRGGYDSNNPIWNNYKDNYGIKASHISNLVLRDLVVQGSGISEIDLNTINIALVENIVADGQNTPGFGLMILDSNNVTVNDITTNGNAWGGVSVQTRYAVSDNIFFSGNFDVQEDLPLLLEKDPSTYYDIIDVDIPDKFQYVVYDFREGDNYKQWYYFETLEDAKTVAQNFVASEAPIYSDVIIYDITKEDYYVIEGMKIQDAINAASSGDIINVGLGIYTTNGQIIIDKDLTLTGTGGKPTIQPNADLPQTNNVAGAWFLINSDVTFNFNNFVMDGNGFKVQQAIRSHGTTTIDSVDFLNIKNNVNPYVGFAIASFGGTVPGGAGSDTHSSSGAPSVLTVTNSNFEQIGRIGILIKGTDSTSTLSNNVYNGKGEGDFLDYAFESGAGGSMVVNNNIISNNRGVAASDGSTSAGILVTDYYGTGTQATITGNTITNSYDGIAVGYDETDESIVIAHNNNLAGNTFGIESTNPLVDAENNYWGNESGPTHLLNPSGTGDVVSDNVDFIPWCTDEDCEEVFNIVNIEKTGTNILTQTGNEDIVYTFDPELVEEIDRNTDYFYGVNAVSSINDIINNVKWKITISKEDETINPGDVQLEEVGWFDTLECSIKENPEDGEFNCTNVGSELYSFSDEDGSITALGTIFDVDNLDDFTNVDRIKFTDSASEGKYTITRQLVSTSGDAISNGLEYEIEFKPSLPEIDDAIFAPKKIKVGENGHKLNVVAEVEDEDGVNNVKVEIRNEGVICSADLTKLGNEDDEEENNKWKLQPPEGLIDICEETPEEGFYDVFIVAEDLLGNIAEKNIGEIEVINEGNEVGSSGSMDLDNLPNTYSGRDDVPIEVDITSTDGTVSDITITFDELTEDEVENEDTIGIPNLNIFIDINADPLTDGTFNAQIRLYYNQSDVDAAGIDESTLRLYYYDVAGANWVPYNPPDDGGVDVEHNFVWANTDHFSTWGIFGSLVPTSSGGSSGGGGSSNGNRGNVITTQPVEQPKTNKLGCAPGYKLSDRQECVKIETEQKIKTQEPVVETVKSNPVTGFSVANFVKENKTGTIATLVIVALLLILFFYFRLRKKATN